MKPAGISNYDQSTRCANRGRKLKHVQVSMIEISWKEGNKELPFGFLQADDGSGTLCNFISQGIPFRLRVDAPNIPNQNVDCSVVTNDDKQEVNKTRQHKKAMKKKATARDKSNHTDALERWCSDRFLHKEN